jgi:NAD(P)-dependent dehydrogenase (short-subunit alcohol dehydrogenase family)
MARGKARLKSAAAEIQAAGGETLVLSADVADAAIEAAAETVLGAWGKIAAWINNAMVTVFGTVETIAPDEFRRVTEIAYLGQVHGTQTALKHMVALVEEQSSASDRH